MTLFELLITILISSILLLSSVISYREFMLKNQLNYNINKIVGMLHYAQSLAINSKNSIMVAPAESDWQNGFVITDINHQKIFRTYSAISKQFTLTFRSSLGDNHFIEWQADGFTFGQQGSFLLCNTKNTHQSAKITILRTGHVQSELQNGIGCHS